jgi:serine/threonine-protein kinase RsbW
MLECRFRREIGSLESIFDFVRGYFSLQGIDPERAYDVDLVIEELFTNMVKYSPESGRSVSVSLEHEGDLLTIVLRDFDVDPWDVTQARQVDTTRPLDERRAGGLGLHFVRQIADSITYSYDRRVSTITITKRLVP